MPDPGTIIDERYRVISRIGTGGMADVFLAEDLQLGRRVAVKILHRRFAEDQEFVERFRREASSAASLSHPNIVSVFDRGEWDGTYWIAMEYLPGLSLKTMVREQGPLEPVVAIDYVTQMLRAARFAHRRGVIHRDLKPHNVIVDEDGRVRVTDFGIARAGASDMTQTGSIMGTAQYLSPEQAQGHAVTAASDLYAIGIVLYELLTGSLPFDGETAVTIALKQVSEAPMPPSTLNPAVPPSLDAVVLCALAKDPAARFADADAFIAALERVRSELISDGHATAQFAVIEAPAVAAHGPGTAPPPPRTALAVPALQPPAQPPEPEEDEEEDGEGRRWWWIAGAVALVVAAVVAALLLLHHARETVPTLAGCETQAVANAQLSAAGLRSVTRYETSLACPAGRVVGQNPSGGTVVRKGSAVILTVSSGPGMSAIPDVVGEKQGVAVDTLRAAGFRTAVTKAANATVPGGEVISTNPPATAIVLRGSRVQLLVSSGPQAVPVPDVVAQSQTDAEVALLNAGLKLGAVTKESSNQTPGTVISQTPAPGTSVPAGAAVTLVVAKAPANVAVPNVVGKGPTKATNALSAAGFAVTTTTTTVTDTAENNRVVSQSPSAGQSIKPGSTVTITIGMLASSTTSTSSTTSALLSTSTSTTATPTAPAGGGPQVP